MAPREVDPELENAPPPASEADDPDTGDQPDTPPEPTPPPEDEPEAVKLGAAPQSEKEMERALKMLETEAARHARRIGEIMGEDSLGLIPCELCAQNLPGFRFPVEPDDDQRAAVLAALGLTGAGNYEDAPDAEVCDECRGKGRTVTGSLVPEHLTKMCRKCRGAGWLEKGGATVVQLTPPPPAGDQAAPAGGQTPEAPPAEDPWGRRQGDPLYGVMPGYEAGR